NHTHGPLPPAANPVPPQPPPCCRQPERYHSKAGAVWLEELEELVAASDAAATGIALSLVTTNSQAIASYGGLVVSPTNLPGGQHLVDGGSLVRGQTRRGHPHAEDGQRLSHALRRDPERASPPHGNDDPPLELLRSGTKRAGGRRRDAWQPPVVLTRVIGGAVYRSHDGRGVAHPGVDLDRARGDIPQHQLDAG